MKLQCRAEISSSATTICAGGWRPKISPEKIFLGNQVKTFREGFTGNAADTTQLFEQAAAKALVAEYIQDCGLAYEHLARMQHRLALDNKTALDAAIDTYKKWGAQGKINYLHEQYFG